MQQKWCTEMSEQHNPQSVWPVILFFGFWGVWPQIGLAEGKDISVDQLEAFRSCRQLAERPVDGGLALIDIATDLALPACEIAVQAFPDEPIALYLYGRAHEAADAFDVAGELYRRASELGSGPAAASMGLLVQSQSDPLVSQGAVDWYALGASRDDSVAAYHWYDSDRSLGLNKQRKLLMRALEARYQPALIEMANIILAQQPLAAGLTLRERIIVLEAASAAGDSRAIGALGQLLVSNGEPNQQVRGTALLREAAAMGDSRSAGTLGLLIVSGHIAPLPGDDPRQLLELAADQGDARVQSTLAAIIISQDGANADPQRLVRLLQTAASQGDANAATNLGTLYRTGFIVEQNMDRAARWYLAGAALGNVAFSNEMAGIRSWDVWGSVGMDEAIQRYLEAAGVMRDDGWLNAITRYVELMSSDPLSGVATLIND